MTDRLTILVVGTLPPPLGGAAVSLRHLIDLLTERDDLNVLVCDAKGIRGRPFTGPFRLLRMLWRTLLLAHRADVVSVHAVSVHLIGPIGLLAARVWRKPLVVRKFAGTDYRDFRGLGGALSRMVVRSADLYLVQARALVQSARDDGLKAVEWYPTSRPMDDATPPPQEAMSCRRFVFLSLVRPTKGIHELIAAAERFGADVSVHVYGPMHDGITASTFDGLRRVEYKGIVPPDRVVDTLKAYDALLLPTYWPGEGYAGIIIEAYAAGIPVIATRWRHLPEIVDETCGLLVEPKNADDLYEAMRTLVEDQALFRRLRSGVVAKRPTFDARHWADRFVEFCRPLAEARR